MFNVYRYVRVACLFFVSSTAFAVNENPASVGFVEAAIEAAIQQNTYTAGTGISITNLAISTDGAAAIGDLRDGGIVFYVDATKQHGLIVSVVGQGTAVPGSSATGIAQIYAYGTGVGAGVLNTAALLAAQESETTASATTVANAFAVQSDGTTLCELPTSGGTVTTVPTSCFGGWYLGSLYEMQLISLNFTTVNTAIAAITGGEALSSTTAYWSSSFVPSVSGNLYNVNVSTGVGTPEAIGNSEAVRAIRQF